MFLAKWSWLVILNLYEDFRASFYYQPHFRQKPFFKCSLLAVNSPNEQSYTGTLLCLAQAPMYFPVAFSHVVDLLCVLSKFDWPASAWSTNLCSLSVLDGDFDSGHEWLKSPHTEFAVITLKSKKVIYNRVKMEVMSWALLNSIKNIT